MSTIPRPVTADQLMAMPDDGKRYELVAGVLHMMSPAGGEHGWIASRLDRLLGNHVDARDLGTVFAAETGFLISTTPDTFYRSLTPFVVPANTGHRSRKGLLCYLRAFTNCNILHFSS